MPKSKSKRRKLCEFESLSNLTGFEVPATTRGMDESLEDCMAQFQQPDITPAVHAAPATQGNKQLNTAPYDHTTSVNDNRAGSHGIKRRRGHEKVESWNRTLQAWLGGGQYSPGLLPNIEEELERNFKVKELSSHILRAKGDIRMPVFERWLLDSKVLERENKKSLDPVIPVATNPKSEPSIWLRGELLRSSEHDSDEIDRMVSGLCRKTNLACQELLSRTDSYKRQSPLKKGDRIIMEDHECTVTILYSRKKWKKPFCFKLNKSHYEKLCQRFFEVHNQGETRLERKNEKVLHSFNVMVLALLLRYSALSGGQLLEGLRGGGMQGAVHGQVFSVLRSNFDGPLIEGFASPFNVCLQTYCSAFPDLEWHFGSEGSFMDYSFPHGGCCEVNPPFSPKIMDSLVVRIEQHLDMANLQDIPLTFVVVVPTANDALKGAAPPKRAAVASFLRMKSSSSCMLHVHLPAREHGYLEGSQHLRPTQYKQSLYDTSVLVLQSNKAKLTPVRAKKLRGELVTAFATMHHHEMVQRRKHENKN